MLRLHRGFKLQSGFWRNLTISIYWITLSAGFFAGMTIALHHRGGNSDPLRQYHLAVARLTAKNEWTKNLPQGESLSRDQPLFSKNTLFDSVLSSAYLIGKEAGGEKRAEALIPLFSGTIFLLVLLVAKTYVPLTISALCAWGTLALTQPFIWQISLLRPQLLAVLLFLCTLASYLRGWRIPTFILGIVFALTGFAGLRISPGLESPIASNQFLIQHAYCFAILLFAFLRPMMDFWLPPSWQLRKLNQFKNFLLITGFATVLMAITPLNPEVIAYAAPCCAILLSLVISTLPRGKTFPIHGLICLSWILQLPNTTAIVRKLRELPQPSLQDFYSQSLTSIPIGEGRTVFTCNPQDGAYIFYARPDIQIAKTEDSGVSNLLLSGPDTYFALKKTLHVDYLLCKDTSAFAFFEEDSHFKKIFPLASMTSNPAGISIFELRPDELPSSSLNPWVTRFEAGALGPFTPSEFLKSTPSTTQNWSEISKTGDSRYLDLSLWLRRAGAMPPLSEKIRQISCAAVRPHVEEITLHQGSTILGIGGGRQIRLWLNGAPFYYTQDSPKNAKLIHQFIRLPHPLHREDRLEALICSSFGLPFQGVSFSFWSDSQIEKWCAWKTSGMTPILSLKEDPFHWSHRGSSVAANCIAPFAPN